MTSQRSQIINDGAVAGEEEACGKKRHSHSRVVARDATVSYNMGTWYKIVPNVLTVPASLGLVSDGYSLVLYYSTVLLLYSEQGQGGVVQSGCWKRVLSHLRARARSRGRWRPWMPGERRRAA